jgi:hypothetical protein
MNSFDKKELSHYVLCNKKGQAFCGRHEVLSDEDSFFWNTTPCCGVFPDVPKHRSAFALRVKQFQANSRARI